MTTRSFLIAGLGALTLVLAACGGGSEAPPAEVALDDILDRSITDQAAYLEGYRLGEQFIQQDSTFNVDEFLRGLRTGYETDSAVAFPYAFGYQRGLELQIQGRRDSIFRPNLEIYATAIREAFEGDSIRIGRLAEQDIADTLRLQQIRRDAGTNPQAQAFLDRLEAAGAQADSFLTANAAQDSVQTTETGLQYIVRTPGNGTESPTEDDRVLVNYSGRFMDGTVFDRSPEGQPVDFEVDGVVAGMTEALLDMTIGERRTIFIAPRLGYGMMGDQRRIGPNSVLIFDLELVDILDPVADPTENLDQIPLIPAQPAQ